MFPCNSFDFVFYSAFPCLLEKCVDPNSCSYTFGFILMIAEKTLLCDIYHCRIRTTMHVRLIGLAIIILYDFRNVIRPAWSNNKVFFKYFNSVWKSHLSMFLSIKSTWNIDPVTAFVRVRAAPSNKRHTLSELKRIHFYFVKNRLATRACIYAIRLK